MKLTLNSISLKFMVGIFVTTFTVMGINLWWNLEQQRAQALSELRDKSAVIAQQLVATRAFIAQNQDKINRDSRGHFEFKHLNPAVVGRGIGEIFARNTDYTIKQTRLKVRYPGNAPDPFEREGLRKFQANPALKELWGEDQVGGKRVFRYMIPLYFQKECLQCHGSPKGSVDIAGYQKEGYREGDFAGAISITTPIAPFEANIRQNALGQVLFSLALVVLLIGLIYILMRELVTRPLAQVMTMVKEIGQGNLAAGIRPIRAHGEIQDLAREFQAMAAQLKTFYDDLEEKVARRTNDLSLANTKLAQQQVQLQEINAQLERANRLKSEFLANMSHELRTPLTAIMAFAEMMLNRAAGEITELQEEYLNDILESSSQLLGLINDLLDLSKIEAGKMELRREYFSVAEMGEQVRRTLDPLAEKKGIVLSFGIPPDLPLVNGDPLKLKQVLVNLVSNALKFTPAGGQVRVTARVDRGSLRVRTGNESELAGAAGPVLVVAVEDTGIGIRPEDYGVIFEKFRQVDGSQSREHRGTGLGLTLCKHLVELHGGRIWVESRLGQGSKFTFAIPFEEVAIDEPA